MFQKLKHWRPFWCIPHCNCTVAITECPKKGRMTIGCHLHSKLRVWHPYVRLHLGIPNADLTPLGVIPRLETRTPDARYARLVCEHRAHDAPFGASDVRARWTPKWAPKGTSPATPVFGQNPSHRRIRTLLTIIRVRLCIARIRGFPLELQRSLCNSPLTISPFWQQFGTTTIWWPGVEDTTCTCTCLALAL